MSSNKRAATDGGDEDDENGTSEPQSKRLRTTSSKEGPDSPDFAGWEEGSVNISKIDDLVEALLGQLQQLKDGSESSSVTPLLRRGLMLMRSWQRNLLHHCASLEKSCNEQLQSKQRQTQAWASLQYEKAHLTREIAAVQNFTMPHLEKVLQQQRESAASDPSLSNLEPNNPSHRSAILEQLQSEIERRSSLEKQRNELKSNVSKLQRKCQREKQTLHQLPGRLANLEKATLPLQQWFSLPFIGTERSRRFELAQQLPAPMYTLFVSIQEHIDRLHAQQAGDSHKRDKDGSMTLRIVPIIGGSSAEADESDVKQPQELLWSLPVPELSTANRSSSQTKRSVTIHFQYQPENGGPRCISANVSGCPTALDQTWLLSRLFPQDSDDSTDYYRWCHYLAGIHLVAARAPAPAPTIESTRAIVTTLQRRVRANATLKHLLQCLSQHKIPSVPVNPSPQTSWQVISFTQQQHKDIKSSKVKNPIFSYDVHCKKASGRGSSQCELRATVQIDKAQYPGVPPRWKLFPAQQDPARPLYNGTWALLEQMVNQDILLESRSMPCEADDGKDVSPPLAAAVEKDNGADAAKAEGEPEAESSEDVVFAEWILVHQLNRLLGEWEQVATAAPAGHGVGRTVRGRDRVPLSLSRNGEKKS